MPWWAVLLACVGLCGAAVSRDIDTPDPPPAPPGPYVASDAPAFPEPSSPFDLAYPEVQAPWPETEPSYFAPTYWPGDYLEQQAAEALLPESHPGYPFYEYPTYQQPYPDDPRPQAWWYGAPAAGWDDAVSQDWPADRPYAVPPGATAGYWQGTRLPPVVDWTAPAAPSDGWLDQDTPPAWAELPPLPPSGAASVPAWRERERPGAPLPGPDGLIELPPLTLQTTQPDRPIPLPGERTDDHGVIGN